MASATQAAASLYDWANGNSSRIASLRAAFDTATEAAYLSKGGADALTSASKNGVSYSKLVQLTEPERIAAMRIALKHLEDGTRPTSIGVAAF